MCNLCNSFVLHCLYGGLGGLEGRRAWEKINDFIIITKCFVITFLPFLLEEKKGDTSDARTCSGREQWDHWEEEGQIGKKISL